MPLLLTGTAEELDRRARREKGEVREGLRSGWAGNPKMRKRKDLIGLICGKASTRSAVSSIAKEGQGVHCTGRQASGEPQAELHTSG